MESRRVSGRNRNLLDLRDRNGADMCTQKNSYARHDARESVGESGHENENVGMNDEDVGVKMLEVNDD